jgi:hypothetical protein
MKKILAGFLFFISALAFAQMSNPGAPGNVTAGAGLTQTGQVISLNVPITVANGGTNSTAASGTALDNITGFSGTGFIERTGAGAYSFFAPVTCTGSGSAIQWSAGFACNSAINAATLL